MKKIMNGIVLDVLNGARPSVLMILYSTPNCSSQSFDEEGFSENVFEAEALMTVNLNSTITNVKKDIWISVSEEGILSVQRVWRLFRDAFAEFLFSISNGSHPKDIWLLWLTELRAAEIENIVPNHNCP